MQPFLSIIEHCRRSSNIACMSLLIPVTPPLIAAWSTSPNGTPTAAGASPTGNTGLWLVTAILSSDWWTASGGGWWCSPRWASGTRARTAGLARWVARGLTVQYDNVNQMPASSLYFYELWPNSAPVTAGAGRAVRPHGCLHPRTARPNHRQQVSGHSRDL